MRQRIFKQGFSLVELLMVVTILAVLSTVAVMTLGSVQKTSGEKVSLANQESVMRSITAFQAQNSGNGPDYLDAVIDFGTATGTAGTFTGNTTLNSTTVAGGVYRGVKFADTSGTAAAPADLAKNVGVSLSGSVSVYYLTSSDVDYLNKVGLYYVLYHNYTSGAASTLGATLVGEATTSGTRAETSGCVPIKLAAGVAVLAVDPNKGSSLYTSFGTKLADYNSGTAPSGDAACQTAATKAGYLLLFGLGCNSSIIGAKNCGLVEAPRSEILDSTYYRQYFMVYRLPGTTNTGTKASFAGAIDPKGQTLWNARFASDWRNGNQ